MMNYLKSCIISHQRLLHVFIPQKTSSDKDYGVYAYISRASPQVASEQHYVFQWRQAWLITTSSFNFFFLSSRPQGFFSMKSLKLAPARVIIKGVALTLRRWLFSSSNKASQILRVGSHLGSGKTAANGEAWSATTGAVMSSNSHCVILIVTEQKASWVVRSVLLCLT